MKRVVLFLLTNIAVLAVLYFITSILGFNQALAGRGLSIGPLLGFAAVMGFGGAIISLLISKPMAKWSTGAEIINDSTDPTHMFIVATVREHAERAGIGMPDVAMYEGEPNAFATGAFKNSALVAVSTGLVQNMTREEVAAVIGHEVSHVANGDMVTLTLIQGVVNTFVIFLARVIGYVIDRALSKGENDGPGFAYSIIVFVLQLVFGILASMIVAWFSRQREFRADAGAAKLLNSPQPMIHALQRLHGLQPGALPQSVQNFGIAGAGSLGALFASHPPIEERIRALEEARG